MKKTHTNTTSVFPAPLREDRMLNNQHWLGYRQGENMQLLSDQVETGALFDLTLDMLLSI